MNDTDRLRRRWRMVLGGNAQGDGDSLLSGSDLEVDRALDALYAGDRRGSLLASAPGIAQWLGEIRRSFPPEVVRLLQRDAIDRLGIERLLLEPETLAAAVPDTALVATLLMLRDEIPPRTLDSARRMVGHLVAQLRGRLGPSLRQSVSAALDRHASRPPSGASEVDWNRTIRANLRHYQPDPPTLVPARLIARPRRRSTLHSLILCLDQSGSMASSTICGGIIGSTLASIPTLRTRVVAFDTSVIDLTDHLADPTDLLFGLRLGGGTDIDQALRYCRQLVDDPLRTTLVLVSDLHDGGDPARTLRTFASILSSGVRVVVFLALDDRGTPSWNHELARSLNDLGVSTISTDLDHFADLFLASTLS